MSYVTSTKIRNDLDILVLYDSKTHKYHITAPTILDVFVISKAKGEAILSFLEWLTQS